MSSKQINEPLLDVRDLSIVFQRSDAVVHAVNGVSFQVKHGEWLGILGESGSGKSVTLRSVLGLLSEDGIVTNGGAWFDGTDLLNVGDRRLRSIRGREIGMVFQSLAEGLNPYMKVGKQIMEPMLAHRMYTPTGARQRTIKLMAEMGISNPEVRFDSYPFELSGGMRQRVMVAVALACQPKLLFADEPTSALDSTVQMQVLTVLMEACKARGMTVVMVTHDLGVAANVCDRIVVMYAGMTMEVADVDAFLRQPAHPYTVALKSASFDPLDPTKPIQPIQGSAPVLSAPPKGCPFASRCSHVVDACHTVTPRLQPVADDHHVACHRAKELLTYV